MCSMTFDNNFESPTATLAMDSTGNLYGTTWANSLSAGHVFKLTPGASGWTYTPLHDFCTGSPCTDGGGSQSSVLVDANGNLYGTTGWGGGGHCPKTVLMAGDRGKRREMAVSRG